MNFKMDNVLWQFSKFYHEKFLADHPASKTSVGVSAMLRKL
jgi:hypothetical protein